MTSHLHRLVGRLILGKVSGTELTEAEEKLLQEGTMGGVTLFKENAATVPQLVKLVDSIRALRKDAIIAVDQEGGAVQRFDHVLSPLPSQMALAACSGRRDSGDSAAVKTSAEKVVEKAIEGVVEKIVEINCRQLKLAGVNCLLGPVLDICCNPLNPIIGSRSFGTSPERVADLGKHYAQAVLANGLVPVGKHFPGHGDVVQDSHLDIATVNVSKEVLFKRELIPFRRCMSYLPAIMVGHIAVPAIDPSGVPASLSYRVTTELLRNQLGFDGVIVTDDLVMGAIAQHYELGEAAVKAIGAGADQVLISGDSQSMVSVHAALMDAIEKGQLSEARLAQSVERIRKTYHMDVNRIKQTDRNQRIETLEHCIPDDSRTCKGVIKSAICLLRGEFPDISSERWMIVVPDHPRYGLPLCEQIKHLTTNDRGTFSDTSFDITEMRFGLNPGDEEIASTVSKVKDRHCMFLGFRGAVYNNQARLADVLAGEINPHHLYCVETDVPSALAQNPRLKNVLATLDPSDAATETLAELLVYGTSIQALI